MPGSAGSDFQQASLKGYEGLVKIMPLELVPDWKENGDKQKGLPHPRGYGSEGLEGRKKEQSWQEFGNM